MLILITGTSSSGKTSIAKEFKRYKKIHVDDYWDKAYVKTYSKLRNDYYNQELLDQVHYCEVRKMMSIDAKKFKNIVIDDIDTIILDYLPKSTKKVLIYTNLKDLTRNLIKRRKNEPRKFFIYEQFSENYVVSNDKNDSIDTVDYYSFVKLLKKVKWNFNSEKDLNIFAKEILENMGIYDKKKHFIKVRDNFYDVIINTKQKTPNDIYFEILNKIRKKT